MGYPARMTTFNDARQVALQAAQERRDRQDGLRLAVADYGWEDDLAFHVVIDSAAYLDGTDPEGFLADGPMWRVLKASGQPERLAWVDALEQREAATPIGDHPRN